MKFYFFCFDLKIGSLIEKSISRFKKLSKTWKHLKENIKKPRKNSNLRSKLGPCWPPFRPKIGKETPQDLSGSPRTHPRPQKIRPRAMFHLGSSICGRCLADLGKMLGRILIYIKPNIGDIVS